MTVIGALSSFRELGKTSPHKRACSQVRRPTILYHTTAAEPTYQELRSSAVAGINADTDGTTTTTRQHQL